MLWGRTPKLHSCYFVVLDSDKKISLRSSLAGDHQTSDCDVPACAAIDGLCGVIIPYFYAGNMTAILAILQENCHNCNLEQLHPVLDDCDIDSGPGEDVVDE